MLPMFGDDEEDGGLRYMVSCSSTVARRLLR